jgi:hypothetical protein
MGVDRFTWFGWVLRSSLMDHTLSHQVTVAYNQAELRWFTHHLKINRKVI